MRLENQVALISGGASGLGLAITQRFLSEGAKVAIFDRSEQALEQASSLLAKEIDAGSIITCQGDVRRFADNQAAVGKCCEAFGKLDCAIGNAGIWDFSKALVDIPADAIDASFDELFHINVKGYLLLAKAAMASLALSNGSLIYTVSNAGFYPDGGGALYTASKHAVVGLIKQLAYELGPHIRVNGVAPGAIDTNLSGITALGMADKVVPGKLLAESIPQITPVATMPSAQNYAGAYVFFASRQDNIPSTGVVLNHDGGMGVRGFGRARGGDRLLEKLGLPENEII